jgi:nucleolar protein 4
VHPSRRRRRLDMPKAEDNAATCFVRNLPYETTDEALEALFSDAGPVREAYVIRDKVTKVGRGFGFVKFVLPDDAERAVTSLHATLFNGKKISVDTAKTRTEAEALGLKKGKPSASQAQSAGNSDAAAAGTVTRAETNPKVAARASRDEQKAASGLKALRLIVRNLSFHCKPEALRKAFAAHGTVLDVNVPMRPDGKHPGFGFVQMSSRSECEAAMAAVNNSKVVGRLVAVDLALSKRDFEKQESLTASSQSEARAQAPDAQGGDLDSEGSAQHSDADGAGREVESDSDGDDDDDDEADDSEADGDDGDDGHAKEKEVAGEHSPASGIKHSGDKEKPRGSTSDTSAANTEARLAQLARTLFVRDVPLQATEKQLSSVLGAFGKLQYISIVRDPATKLSKGTAFACYHSEDGLSAALASEKRPWLLGQSLQLSRATDRESASKAANDRREAVRAKESRRNMHLARLGLKQPDEEGAEHLSLVERRKREDAWKAKKEKLTNPNFIVSDCRLSVRNLPPGINEDRLRELTLQACDKAPKSAGKPALKQVKIVRDDDRLDRQGVPRSRGFGFVQFEKHEHALAALHTLGDNPKLLPDGRMLLVDFAVDNVQKLRVHLTKEKKRAEQQQRHSQSPANGEDSQGGREGDGGSSSRSKLSRGARQREAKRRPPQQSDPAVAAEPSEGPGPTVSARSRGRKRKLPDGGKDLLPTAAFSAPARSAALGDDASTRSAQRSDKGRHQHADGSSPRSPKRSSTMDGMDVVEDPEPRLVNGKKRQRKGAAAAHSEDRFENLVSQYKQQLGVGSKGFADQVKEWL